MIFLNRAGYQLKIIRRTGKIHDVYESTHSVSKVKEAARLSKKEAIKDKYNLSYFLPNQFPIQEENRVVLLGGLICRITK